MSAQLLAWVAVGAAVVAFLAMVLAVVPAWVLIAAALRAASRPAARPVGRPGGSIPMGAVLDPWGTRRSGGCACASCECFAVARPRIDHCAERGLGEGASSSASEPASTRCTHLLDPRPACPPGESTRPRGDRSLS